MSARFQAMSIGALFSAIAKKFKPEQVAELGSVMINTAKSTGELSSAHAKVE